MDWGTGPFKALMRMPPDYKAGGAGVRHKLA